LTGCSNPLNLVNAVKNTARQSRNQTISEEARKLGIQGEFLTVLLVSWIPYERLLPSTRQKIFARKKEFTQ